MPRPKAKCGTYSAYKRHKREGEPVDEACRRASDERVAEQRDGRKAGTPKKPVTPPADEFGDWEDFDSERRDQVEIPPSGRSRQERLEWQLSLLEEALAVVATSEPAKMAPLAKRHSELLAELATLTGSTEKEADPFDEFFNGDLSNVARFPAPKDREAS
jgi:hypothetical protein